MLVMAMLETVLVCGGTWRMALAIFKYYLLVDDSLPKREMQKDRMSVFSTGHKLKSWTVGHWCSLCVC